MGIGGTLAMSTTVFGENRPLVADATVEFQKDAVEVQDWRREISTGF